MANPGITRDDAEAAIRALEAAVQDGFSMTGKPSAFMEAARRLDMDHGTYRGRLRAAKRQFGLEPGRPVPAHAPNPTMLPAEALADPIEVRRLRDQLARVTKERDDAQRAAVDAQDIRAGVLGLVSEPLRPRLEHSPTSTDHSDGRTVILHLSDVHYGETIALDEMDGVNRFDSEIARLRLGRFFSKSADLMTEHWSGAPPDEIILCLGGDLISGDIHPELAQTNDPSVPATVREVGEHIAGGIELLRAQVNVPVRVYSVPGNHGRLTIKPQSKGRAAGSLDLLATDFAEAALRGAREGVSFYRTSSPDALFSVYGWHWLLNHGDTMGGRGGGTGFIGPMASIIKGHRKLVDTAWRSGRAVHFILTGHWHTTGKSAFGWANGSVCGYSEYGRDLRCDPEPARQNYLVVHPRLGVIEERMLFLGVPSEGSSYAGPASLVRPPVLQEVA